MSASLKAIYGGSGSDNVFGTLSFFADPSTEVTSRAISTRRHIPIIGSTDFIQTPDPCDYINSTATDGYRRIDKNASGGASEWSLDWNAIGAFSGFTPTDSNVPNWSGCYLKGSHIFILIEDFDNAIGNGLQRPHIIKANINTGSIVSITPITGVGGIVNSATLSLLSQRASFWYMNDSEQLVVWGGGLTGFFDTGGLGITNEAREKGFGKVVWSQDGSTVLSSDFYFDLDLPNPDFANLNTTGGVSYVTADENIVYVQPLNSSFDSLVFAINENIRIAVSRTYTSDSETNQSIFSKLGTGSTNDSAIEFNCLIGNNTVVIGRVAGGSSFSDISPVTCVSRQSLDDALKQYIFKSTGVAV